MPENTPMSGATTIHPNNQNNNVPEQPLSDAQKNYIDFRRRRMIAAKDIRDTARTEYDGMPYLQYYEILKRADDQYVAPRKNASDTSINLGTVRDKDTSLVEYAMSQDFEPVAQVFDEDDDLLEELAETGEDMVRKSLMLESWEDKAKLVYRSMVAFGTALVEDAWVERWVIEKTFAKGFRPGMATSKAEWTERLVKQYDGCQTKLWDQRKCYFGDIRKFFMNGPQGQPYFFTVEYESYDMVKPLFGAWDNFKYVPQYIRQAVPETAPTATFSAFWTLRPVSINYCEIIRYYDPIANEFALMINGIDMLPLMERKETVNGEEKTFISGYPLTEVSPSGAIPFAKFDLEPMHDFAISKSQPGKMRVTADVENMMIKLFIQIMKQKAKPTMGNMGGKNFGPEIFDAGTVINDVREGELFPVLPVQAMGLVPADFSFFELMKKEQDKQSVERSFQGMNANQQDETATKDMNNRQAQSLKVAALLDGILFGNKQLYWMRTYNIMKNWTKPIDKQVDVFKQEITNVYRTVSMPSESNGGQKGTKKIIFTKSTPKLEKGKKSISLEDSMKIHQDELDQQKEKGGAEVRLVYLHPELFASMNLNWYYDCVPVPRASDPLSYMVFAKQIQDAMTFFGPQSLNVKKLKHRFAALTGNDFDTWFLNQQELQQAQAAVAPPAGAPPTPGAGASPAIGAPAPAPAIPPAAPSVGGQPSIASSVQNKVPTLGPLMR